MKAKLKNFFNHPIISALLFNGGVLVVLLLIACPKYSTDIDILMQSILYGISGGGVETHLIYSSILFGKALKMLLEMAPGIAWYSVAQFVLVFAGLFSMTYVFLRRPSNLVKRLIILFFLCFAGYECYIMPSYIKTAVVLCVGAFCLLADAMTVEKPIPKENLNEKPKEEPGEKPAEELDKKPIEEVVELPEEGLDKKPEEELDNKPAEELGNKPTEELDNKTADELGNKPTEELNEKPEEVSDEKPNEELDKKPEDDSNLNSKFKTKKTWVLYLWSALIFWLSSLISFRVFLFTAVICFGGILILYIGKKKLKIGAIGIIAIVVAAAAIAGSQGYDSYKYTSDATYAAEKENAQAIEKIYAFGHASYSDEVEELTGLTSEEYSAFTSGRFISYDDNVTDYFPIVAGIGYKVNGQNILKFFRTVPIRMFQYALFFCCAILVALAYLSISGKRNRRIIIMPVVLWLASYLVLFFGNAWSGSVVRLVVLLPICALTLMQYEELPVRYLRELAAFTCIFALIMYSSFHSKLVMSVQTDSIEEDYMDRWIPEKTYAIDAVSYLKQYTIFQVYPEGLFDKDNISIVNGIYRDVHGFEINDFVNDRVLEKEVFCYDGKMAEDILIE